MIMRHKDSSETISLLFFVYFSTFVGAHTLQRVQILCKMIQGAAYRLPIIKTAGR